jgi:phosphatidylserine/phosphatidylglycerophosphate/cardiolipin synthase-like enzyme
MALDDVLNDLALSLADGRLSRGERQGLAAALADLDDDGREQVRRRAFELARSAPEGPPLDWLDDVMKALVAPPARDQKRAVEIEAPEAWFSPANDCARRIGQLFARARGRVDVAVFTITDDRITEAILEAHRRGVAIRVLTDNEKAFDLGSDIERLSAAGVAVLVDQTPFHLHHKFAIFDGSLLLTGSYNWTRGAARDNQENFLITPDARLVGAYARAFEDLWGRLA